MKRVLCGLFLAGLMAGGCAAPNPVQLHGLALVSVNQRTITIIVMPCATNAPGAAAEYSARDADTQSVTPSQQGVCIFMDNQITLPNGGGTAASNSVLSGIEFTPLK